MRKRMTALFLLLAALAMLAGCQNQGTEKTTAAAKTLSLQETVANAAADSGDLAALTAEDLTDMLGIEPAEYSEFVFLQSTGMDGREILVLRAADGDAAGKLAEKLEKYLERRRKETRDYAPEAYRLLSEAKVRTKNRTVALIAGTDAEKEADAILAGE